MIFVKLTGYGVSARHGIEWNQGGYQTCRAGPAEPLSVHPSNIAKQWFKGMFCDLKRYDMGLFFVKKNW